MITMIEKKIEKVMGVPSDKTLQNIFG